MTTVNALVTAVGGTIGQSVCKALCQSGLDIRIVGVDMDPLAAGLFLCDKSYVVPSVEDPSCFASIAGILKKERIHALFVSSDTELAFFSKNKERFEDRTKAKILVSSPRVIAIGNDKWNTFVFFRENGILCPETALGNDAAGVEKLAANTGFPLIVKPRFSSGSRDIHKVDNAAELGIFIKNTPGAIAQQYIPLGAGEFTGAGFCDGTGRILGTIVMRRELKHGTTFRSELVMDRKYYKFIEKVIRLLRPQGSCNIQFRDFEGKIYPIEINPRFSSTSCMRSQMGFNDAEMAIKVFVLRKKPGPVRLRHAIALRYWDEIFLKGNSTRGLTLKKANKTVRGI